MTVRLKDYILHSQKINTHNYRYQMNQRKPSNNNLMILFVKFMYTDH